MDMNEYLIPINEVLIPFVNEHYANYKEFQIILEPLKIEQEIHYLITLLVKNITPQLFEELKTKLAEIDYEITGLNGQFGRIEFAISKKFD